MNIDSSYFTKGRRYILNATAGVCQGTNNHAVNSRITDFINQYSPAFLEKVFGREKAKEILENEGDDEQLRLLFEGVKEPMADFVMFYILRYSGQRATIDGVVELKCGNTIISPALYQANVWNEMADGLLAFVSVHPEIRVDQCLLTKISSCWV